VLDWRQKDTVSRLSFWEVICNCWSARKVSLIFIIICAKVCVSMSNRTRRGCRILWNWISFVCMHLCNMYKSIHTHTRVAYLQLSISIWHSCRSIGKYCKFMGHDAVIVKLKHIQWSVRLTIASWQNVLWYTNAGIHSQSIYTRVMFNQCAGINLTSLCLSHVRINV